MDDEARKTMCPCCRLPVTTRDHVHMFDEAITMLRANLDKMRDRDD